MIEELDAVSNGTAHLSDRRREIAASVFAELNALGGASSADLCMFTGLSKKSVIRAIHDLRRGLMTRGTVVYDPTTGKYAATMNVAEIATWVGWRMRCHLTPFLTIVKVIDDIADQQGRLRNNRRALEGIRDIVTDSLSVTAVAEMIAFGLASDDLPQQKAGLAAANAWRDCVEILHESGVDDETNVKQEA